MATSSITKNFVISGKEQVEMFVNAIEESAKNRPVRTPVNVKFIETEDELREFISIWHWEMTMKPGSLRLFNCSPDFLVQRIRM